MADAMPAGEFDCTECGRHIIQIAGPVSEFQLCAACLTIPGWYTVPEIVRLLDPNNLRRMSDV